MERDRTLPSVFRSILPIFPQRVNDGQTHLLLANVFDLSDEEKHRRDPHCYPSPHAVQLTHLPYPSDLAIYYQHHYVDVMQRLQIDAAILDCNYLRLRHCLNLFADQRIRRLHVSPFEVQLPEHERPLAMEFFLQIDVDLFYMKSDGLFCRKEAKPQFTMIPCRQCQWCCSRSPTKFSSSHTFVFRNGYRTMLNANAVRSHNKVSFADAFYSV